MCLCDINYRRNRYWNNAMLTANRALTFTQKRYNYFRDIQIIQTYCHCKNIHNRIYCSYLMKMYLIC